MTFMKRTVVAALLAIAVPWSGLGQARHPSFEVASVKRNTVDEFPDFTPRRSGDRITMHSVRLASVVMPFARDGNLSVATSAPNLITAIEEELGLKLKGSKGPVEVLVVDHVDKPSEN